MAPYGGDLKVKLADLEPGQIDWSGGTISTLHDKDNQALLSAHFSIGRAMALQASSRPPSIAGYRPDILMNQDISVAKGQESNFGLQKGRRSTGEPRRVDGVFTV